MFGSTKVLFGTIADGKKKSFEVLVFLRMSNVGATESMFESMKKTLHEGAQWLLTIIALKMVGWGV